MKYQSWINANGVVHRNAAFAAMLSGISTVDVIWVAISVECGKSACCNGCIIKRNSGFAQKKNSRKKVQKKTKTIKMRWRSSNKDFSMGGII